MSKHITVPDRIIALSKKAKGKNYREGVRQGLLFYSLIIIEQPKIAVEIGCQVGLSTCFMAMAMGDNEYQDKAGHVYGIDKEAAHVNSTKKELEYLGLSKFATTLHGDSKEVIHRTMERNSIGFMFIDGDHSRDKVYSDIYDNIDFIRNNALVVFHDYNAYTKHGVDDALNDLEAKGYGFDKIRIDILTNGLLIKKTK